MANIKDGETANCGWGDAHSFVLIHVIHQIIFRYITLAKCKQVKLEY